MICLAPTACRPRRCGHGSICGGWRHPAGRGLKQAANDPRGLHRCPRDSPAPLRRRIPAAPAGAGPDRFGGHAPTQAIDRTGRTVAEVFRIGQNVNLALGTLNRAVHE